MHSFDVVYHVMSDAEWADSLEALCRWSSRHLALHQRFLRLPQLVPSKIMKMRPRKQTIAILERNGFRQVDEMPTYFLSKQLLTYRVADRCPTCSTASTPGPWAALRRRLGPFGRVAPHQALREDRVKQQPEQQAPPVQRLRVRYAKRGRMRFTSHRDFSRAFERAVFRARVPMAYSSGFNPHPRISYAGAAPTGSASEAEYLELALAEVVVAADVHAMLDEALPPGLDVLEVAESPGGSLADLLEASRWRIGLSADHAAVTDAVARFLAADEVLVERMTKKGMREFDARGAVLSLVVDAADEAAPGRTSMDVVLRHGTPAVRPDDVLRGLEAVAGLPMDEAPLMTRLAQGPLLGSDQVGDPLADRA